MKKRDLYTFIIYIALLFGLVLFNIVYLIIYYLQPSVEGVFGNAGAALSTVVMGTLITGIVLYIVDKAFKRNKPPTPK